MGGISHKRAAKKRRTRIKQQRDDMVRCWMVILKTDLELLRSLASRLAENDSEAARIRAIVARSIADKASSRGGILAALRRSPLVSSNLNVRRSVTDGRRLDF
jgi:hypothetical protein